MINFVGYAVSHDTMQVWLLQSDYADRKSVHDNAERCISDAMGYPCYVSDVVVHTPKAGEDAAEQAELLARDGVTGYDGMETGYTFHSVPVTVSHAADAPDTICARLARELNTGKAAMQRMYASWQMLNQEHDEVLAAEQFGAFVARMRAVY